MEWKDKKRMKRKRNDKASESFNVLMGSYIDALAENSQDISSMLEELKKRKLSNKDKKELKSFKKAISKLDDELRDIGE